MRHGRTSAVVFISSRLQNLASNYVIIDISESFLYVFEVIIVQHKESSMGTVHLTIDGQDVAVEQGRTILEAARSMGIRIPTLCYHDRMKPIESCRICVVEIEGVTELLPACSTPANSGMNIQTHSQRVVEARRKILAMLLQTGHHDCPVCDKAGECVLQDLVYEYGISGVKKPETWLSPIPSYRTTFIKSWPERCIACLRCVTACNEIQGIGALTQTLDVHSQQVIAYDPDLCTSCGECIQVCPVGALLEMKSHYRFRPWETTKVRTTCPYCGVGCQLQLHVKDGKIVRVLGVEDAEPNKGRLCVKGRYGFDFIYSQERLTTPLVKEKGEFREASWDEALDLIAGKFQSIIAESGPDALAGVSCARSINEDSYQMQKLFRAVFKTNNIDHCART